MRYLVTGGAGFIGSHLSEVLLAAGHEVTILDDLSTGSIENISGFRDVPSFHYVMGSVHDRPVLAELVDGADVVVHLAAAVGVRLIVESPVRTIETNVHGTELVLELANKKKKRVLLASTSEVYGKSDQVPFREDGDLLLGPPTKGRWAYACSKAIGEFLGLAYWREKKLPVTIVRLFNTVGPRQTGRYGMVIPSFVRQALLGQPITVFGDGRQSRCFAHVRDVTSALTHVLEEPRSTGEVYNVGSDVEITIGELAELIKRRTGSTSKIVHVPYDEAYGTGFEDMQRRVPSLQKVKDLTGYEPSRDVAAIIDDVIAHEDTSRLNAAALAP